MKNLSQPFKPQTHKMVKHIQAIRRQESAKLRVLRALAP